MIAYDDRKRPVQMKEHEVEFLSRVEIERDPQYPHLARIVISKGEVKIPITVGCKLAVHDGRASL